MIENPSLSGVSFQLETWEDYYNDPSREALWLEHYGEIAKDKGLEPMSPDVPFFAFCQSQGRLQVLTVRRAGRMIGYTICILRRHTHYATFCGFEDSYYLTQSERKGGVGAMMFARTLAALKARGVKKVLFMNKLAEGLDIGKLFERMGFEETDRVWQKWL